MGYCRNCGAPLPEGAAFCQNCGTPIRRAAEPAVQTAEWGERFIAWLIDFAIIAIFLSPTKYFWSWAGLPLFGRGLPFLRWIPFSDFADSIIYFLYWTLMEGMYGQSIGKMALKLRVTRLDGRPIDIGVAAIQSLGKAFLLPIDCIIGWILYPNKKQRLFNYISGTTTVKIRS